MKEIIKQVKELSEIVQKKMGTGASLSVHQEYGTVTSNEIMEELEQEGVITSKSEMNDVVYGRIKGMERDITFFLRPAERVEDKIAELVKKRDELNEEIKELEEAHYENV